MLYDLPIEHDAYDCRSFGVTISAVAVLDANTHVNCANGYWTQTTRVDKKLMGSSPTWYGPVW